MWGILTGHYEIDSAAFVVTGGTHIVDATRGGGRAEVCGHINVEGDIIADSFRDW